ncbi:hypothetical protein IQ06DRAFT_299837 [Phaeosphaeriaceae sp. SRC1lsM3a]|nr:hypothetical protein IQ06DRAFT_299837 [Stagonospora sp. SRC1lsM3a]
MAENNNEPNVSTENNGDATMEDAAYDPDAELTQLANLDTLYYYAVPPGAAGDDANDRQSIIRKTIDPLIEKDLKHYKIKEAPDEIGAGEASVETKNQIRHQWRLDQLYIMKRKATLAYGLKDLKQLPVGNELEEKLSELEELEIELDIDARQRDLSMSDEDWSNFKHQRIKESQADPEAQKKREEEQKNDAEQEKKDAEAQKQLHQNAVNAAEATTWRPVDTQIRGLRNEERSKELNTLHKTISALVLKWWESKPDAQDLRSCNAINTQLSYVPNGEKWKFTPSEIDFWQTRVRESLIACERVNSDDSKLLELAHNAITFTNTLRKVGLDWKMVTGMALHRRLFVCLRTSEDAKVRESVEQLEKAYFAPRKEQIEVLRAALPVIVPVMHENGRTNENTLSFCQQSFHHLNKTLGTKNLSLGLPKIDHCIPITDIEDAVRYYGEGRPTEAESAIAKMMHKIDLLGIPGFEEMPRGNNFDRTQARTEVLNISKPNDISRFIADVPPLKSFSRQRLYPDVHMTTVAWGGTVRKFYINMYGPSHAPIFRIERYMSPEWALEYRDGEPPLEFKITIPRNRYGDTKDQLTGKKVYGAEHVYELRGVAFTEKSSSEDPLELIDPETYDLDNPGRPDRWLNDYVLVAWDLDLDGKNVVSRWEPRSVIRERYGKVEGDQWIYESADEAQQKFDKERGAPSNTKDGKNDKTTAKTGKSMFTYPAVDEEEDEEEDEAGNYTPSAGTRRSKPSVATKSAPGGLAIRTLLTKCSADKSLSAEARATIMCQKFGEAWPEMLFS